ncbi:MAG TPA: plastocyanin/azurin family copper-binding protein [Gemmatimonadaceae bacterium]|nr:plastocyanin/azurin family copper-binding protein [Gemmatimonadaceae bacterium]
MRKSVAMICIVTIGCGGSGIGDYGTSPDTPSAGNPAGSANTNEISIADQNFTPNTTTVPKGTKVTWTWNSCTDGGYGGYAGCVMHNVTFDDGSNISSAVQDSGTFNRTFAAAGTYKYHCSVHGAAMSGQIIVN